MAGAGQVNAQQNAPKSYESGNKEFPGPIRRTTGSSAMKPRRRRVWRLPSGPPTGASGCAELASLIQKIKLAPGFKIEVNTHRACWRHGEKMAWGDKGTLFVGSFGLGNVYAITDNGGREEGWVKTILKDLNMPTGLAFRDGALYVIAVDKLIKYDNAEAHLDNLGQGARWCMTTCRLTPPMAGSIWRPTRTAGSIFLLGPPFNIGIPPTSVAQIRRVDPQTGNAEIVRRLAFATASVAMSIRAAAATGSTENARDWMSDDTPSDKLNMITPGSARIFGYPHCHQGDMPDPKFAMGHECSEFTPPVLNLGAHVAPLGTKFSTGT